MPDSRQDGASLTQGEAGVLPRRLGVAGLVLLIVAFNAPIAAMAGFIQLSIGYGNGLGAPMSFLVAGAMLLLFSVGFVGMSRFVRDPGAFYSYVAAGLGNSAALAAAFLATAAYILMCAGAYVYMGLVVVDFFTRLTGGPVAPWPVWAFVFLGFVTVLGFLRVDLSMGLLGKLVLLEIALVALWEGAVFFQGGPEGYALMTLSPATFFHGSAGQGVLFAMLCMIGIEAGACFARETRNPEVTVGRATYLAIAFLAVFYALGAWAYIITQGASNAVAAATADPVGSFFASVEMYLGNVVVHLVSLVLVTSQMAALYSSQGAASRYLFSLGQAGALPSGLATVHKRLESPIVAVSVVSIISAVFLAAVIVMRADPVASYAGLTGTGIYFLLPLMMATCCAVIVFFRKNKTLKASLWRRLIAPVIAMLSLAVLFVLISLNLATIVGTPAMANASIIAVVVAPVTGWLLAAWYKRAKPHIYEAIGNA